MDLTDIFPEQWQELLKYSYDGKITYRVTPDGLIPIPRFLNA